MFGICKLSIVPVRNQPSDKAEIVTQLIFGDVYSISETFNDKWAKVKIQYDGYEGWIDLKQHFEISENYFLDYLNAIHPVVTDLVHFVSNDTQVFPIVFGSTLPFFQYGNVAIEGEKLQYNGNYLVSVKNNNPVLIEQTAIRYFKAPYLWGGKTIFGTDCSGFVQMVFKISGYKLPRDAYQQAEVGEKIAFENSKKGDLCFFSNDEGRVTHVGIMLENNSIIHASGEVRIDLLTEEGILNIHTKQISHKLSGIRRVLE
jgi:gamma-D-glutamyl-L-lysine dipeptidyl-peptidase